MEKEQQLNQLLSHLLNVPLTKKEVNGHVIVSTKYKDFSLEFINDKHLFLLFRQHKFLICGSKGKTLMMKQIHPLSSFGLQYKADATLHLPLVAREKTEELKAVITEFLILTTIITQYNAIENKIEQYFNQKKEHEERLKVLYSIPDATVNEVSKECTFSWSSLSLEQLQQIKEIITK